DEHDESNLAVDIVLQTARPLRRQSAKERHGHGKQNDEREHEAFVLGREREIDDYDSEGKEDQRRGTGLQFFQRNARPLVAVALRHDFGGQFLHGIDGLAGTESGRGGAVEFSGAEEIVVADVLRSGALVDGQQVFERYHGAAVGADVVLLHVLRVRAKLLVGLHVDAVGAVIEIKIVDVGRAHEHAERVDDLAERDVKTLRLLAVDGDDKLGIVGGVGGEQASEIFALVTGAHEVVGGLVEILQGVAALILQLELESSEFAEALDGGRLEWNNNRVGDSQQRTAQAIEDGCGIVFRSLAPGVRLKS